MNTFVKIFTSLAVAAAGAFPAAAFGVSTGGYWTQIGIGYLAEFAVIGPEFWVLNRLEETESDDPSRDCLEIAAISIVVTYPVITAGAVYFAGEAVDGPSARKTRTWGFTTLAATGQSAAFFGLGAAILSDSNSWTDVGIAVIIVLADVFSKPFTTTLWYNRFKERAAEEPAESRGPILEPYVAVTTAGNGRPVPLYGVTLSF